MAATCRQFQRVPNAGSFKPGVSGNPAGKPPGTPNRTTAQAREMAALIVDDPEYRSSLRARVIAGQAPHMEPLLWAYAKGKPADRIEHGVPGVFAELSDDELRARLVAALELLRDSQ